MITKEVRPHGAGVWLAAVLTALAAGGTASAQESQGLKYRTSANAETVIGSTPGQCLEATFTKPEGLALPKMKSARPVFAKWKTPMVPAGFLWLALDSSTAGGLHDRLYVDTNANGRLDDELPIPADAESSKLPFPLHFRQVKVMLAGRDGPVAYHIDIIAGGEGSLLAISAKAAGWYEGAVKIDGKDHNCVLFDSNCNGAFNDAGQDVGSGDRIRIDPSGGFAVGWVGKYAQVEGKIFALEVARDGSRVKFTPAQTSALGSLRAGEGVTALRAGGENGQFLLDTQDGIAISLPAGRYRLIHWQSERKDSSGKTWRLAARAPESGIDFEIAAGKELRLDIGEPIISSFSAARTREGCIFSDPKLTGRGGERVELSCSGGRVPAPGLLIRNADGSFNRRISFSYG